MFLVAGHGHTQGRTMMVPGLDQQSLQGNTQTHRSSRPQPRWSLSLPGRCSCGASLHCCAEKQGLQRSGEAHIWFRCQTSCVNAAVQEQDLAAGPEQAWPLREEKIDQPDCQERLPGWQIQVQWRMQGNLCFPRAGVAQSKFGGAVVSSADPPLFSSSPRSALCRPSQTWRHKVFSKLVLLNLSRRERSRTNTEAACLVDFFTALYTWANLIWKVKKGLMKRSPSTRVQGLHLQCGQ